MNYMAIPKVKVTFGSSENPTDGLLNANIELAENTYWKADLTFSNSPVLYPSIADVGTSVIVEVQDGAVGGEWKTLFNGFVLAPDYVFSGNQAVIKFVCVGFGYALNMMNVAEEFGSTSRHPYLTTIHDILLGNTSDVWGIIPKWVNNYKQSGYPSGYLITHGTTPSTIDSISGDISYIVFPWKPVDSCLDDLCDLVTALNSGAAGPHWIVDHARNLHVKTIGDTQPTWTKYYGGDDNDDDQATLTVGVDFVDGDFQPLGKQANVIVYYGAWRRPSNGDAWTNPQTNSEAQNLWKESTGATSVSCDTSIYKVGTSSVRMTNITSGGVLTEMRYPKNAPAAWDFSSFAESNTPSLNIYIRKHSGGTFGPLHIFLYESDSKYFHRDVSSETTEDVWNQLQIPIGPYYNYQPSGGGLVWQESGGPDWGNINYIGIYALTPPLNSYVCVDGLHFGGAAVCRIARQEFPSEVSPGRGTLGQIGQPATSSLLTNNAASGQPVVPVVDGSLFTVGNVVTISDDSNSENCLIDDVTIDNLLLFHANLNHYYYTVKNAVVTRAITPSNPVQFKVLTDNIGKDDSLSTTDDSGLMAQLAKAELLRLSKATINGKFTTSMIPDVLPGQLIHIDKDYRITKITHSIQATGFKTAFEVTDDLTNSHARLRYEDINKVYAAIRPEYQDRQAASLKSGTMDIGVLPIETPYNI